MPTVNEFLLDAIKFDEIFMAYSVYIAIREGLLKVTDDEKRIHEIQFPDDKIRVAIQSDILKLYADMVKLYLVKYKGDYAVYLARNTEDVEQLHLALFRETTKRIIDMTHKKDIEIYDQQKKKYMSFRNIQENTAAFPCFVCLMESKAKEKVSCLHG